MQTFTLREGDSPLVLSMPHSGVELMPGLASRMTPRAVALVDTDWHIPRLYDFVPDDVTLLQQRFSRYVIDVNRPPSGESLYPGQATTGLCPTTLFDGAPLYVDGEEPDEAEVADRREAYWRPYHDALADQLRRVVTRHGFAVLYDCHSIASEVPRLFEGVLPVLNLGTARGESCDPSIEAGIAERFGRSGLTSVVNGRFVGGYITRHFGLTGGGPGGVHAVQMEIGQDAYMTRRPEFAYAPEVAEPLRETLAEIIDFLAAWRPE